MTETSDLNRFRNPLRLASSRDAESSRRRIVRYFLAGAVIVVLVQAPLLMFLFSRFAFQFEQRIYSRVAEEVAQALVRAELEVKDPRAVLADLHVLNPHLEAYVLAQDGTVNLARLPEVEGRRATFEPLRRWESVEQDMCGFDPGHPDVCLPLSLASYRLRDTPFVVAVFATEGLAAYFAGVPLFGGFLWQLAPVLLLTVLATLPLTFALSQYMTSEFRQIATILQSFIAGDFSERLPIGYSGELHQLKLDMNGLADSQELHQHELRSGAERRRVVLSGILHDLMRPVTSIRLAVDAAIRANQSGPTEVASIREKVNRSLSIQDVLSETMRSTLVDVQESDTTPDSSEGVGVSTELAEVVRQVSAELRGRLQTKQLQLRCDEVSFERLPRVLVPRAVLVRALMNLVENALLYSPACGTVELRTFTERGLVYLEVEDSGPGVSTEEVDFIFLPYYRSERARVENPKGSGLGLANVKAELEKVGAEVNLRPFRSDSGACFVCILPTAQNRNVETGRLQPQRSTLSEETDRKDAARRLRPGGADFVHLFRFEWLSLFAVMFALCLDLQHTSVRLWALGQIVASGIVTFARRRCFFVYRAALVLALVLWSSVNFTLLTERPSTQNCVLLGLQALVVGLAGLYARHSFDRIAIFLICGTAIATRLILRPFPVEVVSVSAIFVVVLLTGVGTRNGSEKRPLEKRSWPLAFTLFLFAALCEIYLLTLHLDALFFERRAPLGDRQEQLQLFTAKSQLPGSGQSPSRALLERFGAYNPRIDFLEYCDGSPCRSSRWFPYLDSVETAAIDQRAHQWGSSTNHSKGDFVVDLASVISSSSESRPRKLWVHTESALSRNTAKNVAQISIFAWALCSTVLCLFVSHITVRRCLGRFQLELRRLSDALRGLGRAAQPDAAALYRYAEAVSLQETGLVARAAAQLVNQLSMLRDSVRRHDRRTSTIVALVLNAATSFAEKLTGAFPDAEAKLITSSALVHMDESIDRYQRELESVFEYSRILSINAAPLERIELKDLVEGAILSSISSGAPKSVIQCEVPESCTVSVRVEPVELALRLVFGELLQYGCPLKITGDLATHQLRFESAAPSAFHERSTSLSIVLACALFDDNDINIEPLPLESGGIPDERSLGSFVHAWRVSFPPHQATSLTST